jgi:hypothetical protein
MISMEERFARASALCATYLCETACAIDMWIDHTQWACGDKFPSIVLPTILGVKQAINGHLVRLTIKARDLRWRAP